MNRLGQAKTRCDTCHKVNQTVSNVSFVEVGAILSNIK